MPPPKRVAIIAYDGVQALDIVGPADAFAAALAAKSTCNLAQCQRFALMIGN
jgi:putative intracellular protease/amidase